MGQTTNLYIITNPYDLQNLTQLRVLRLISYQFDNGLTPFLKTV